MANRYWVGGAGNWSSTTKWSTTSGGASGASVPISTDDVIFDANSGGKFAATVDTAQTVNSITITPTSAAGVQTISITSSLTTGALTTTGTAGNNRIFFTSTTYGISANFIVNGTVSISDCDFRGLFVTGTSSPISGTRIGNRNECTGITFSAPKNVYWNLAGFTNWNSDAWAATSGGGVSTDNFPLAQDTAIFDNSFASGGNITINTGYIGSIDSSNRTTALSFGITPALICYGNWTNGSGVSISLGGSGLTFGGNGIQTITSNGKSFGRSITIDKFGGYVQLADALNIGTSGVLTVTNGTFNTQGYAVTCATLSSTNSNVRTINLGASTLTTSDTNPVNFSTSINLTFNAGTSSIISTPSTATLQGGSQTFYNVSFTSTTAGTFTIIGTNTFNNLTFTAPSTTSLSSCLIGANQTINGTLTCAGASAVRRIFLQSSSIGTQRTLTAAAISATDCDFRDIVLAGAAAGVSPTRAGDCGGNSGITFPAPKTVYWNLAGSQNWSATAWCTGSGGTPDINQYPLAQDTAVFDNTGSAGTVTINAFWNIGTFDASLRTSAMTLTQSSANSPFIYGDWKFGTGVTSSSLSVAFTFAKNGTQTITSNGVQFGSPITINNPNAYVQLADALSLGATRTLTVTNGSFDAVTYNVTTGLFANSSITGTIKMGSGTWTLSGTGTVWNMATVPTFVVETSTIVLSDTSTTARTFAGNGLYYNKLTIGGTTGTSTLTVTGSNTFGELASTKTVAHTIAFGAITQTFGKWSVTGTAGNVVTITGTSTSNVIAGPAVTGVDYLAMGTWGVSTTSPGEFYAGANSTGTAAAPVFRTTAPTPRNLYWVNGTGNWSSTTKWATSSGGAPGAAIPTSLDTVTFDSLSNAVAYTATIDAGVTIARCAAFTMAGPLTGNVTWAGSVPIAYHGSVSFAATGITRTYTGAMNWAGNSSYTFTTNGLVLSNATTVNGIGSTWTLGSALNISSTTITITYGTFSTSGSNYAITAGALASNNSNIRSISFNASTTSFSSAPAITFATATNLTFNAGTSSIVFSTTVVSLNGGTQTFYNVSFISTAATSISITGSNTFNNLTFTGLISPGINAVTFSANQTINGTLTLGAGTAAAYRTFLASNTIGTPRTLTVNALAAGAADIDFRDITVTGAAAPLTGTRFGDCKGNSGISFDAAKTVYYARTGAGSWGTTGTGSWSATSGGALDATMFPLAQDTAVFPAATYPSSGSTSTVASSYNIGTIDMSLRTSNTMTLATGTNSPAIYGNWINGTGTTLSGTGTITFAGRTTQTITSAGKTFTQFITINSPSGSVTLQDAFTVSVSGSGAFSVFEGTLNLDGYTLTCSGATSSFQITASTARTLAFGSGGTITVAGSSGWNASTATNLTVTGTGTISLTNASAKTFTGGSANYSGITLNQGGAGTLTITGNNTFADITDTVAGATTIDLGNTTQTVGAFTAAGTAGNLLTITGTSAASPATLIYTGGGVISGVDYVVPTFVRAYPTTSTWYAGNNSTNGGSLGWIFSSYSPVATGINGQFFMFF